MITTDRDQFIGAHLTEGVKNLVRQDASNKRISMSEWIYMMACEKLKAEGYDLTGRTEVFIERPEPEPEPEPEIDEIRNSDYGPRGYEIRP